MPHFFISYAKKDTRQLALQLNDALNAIPNVTAWVDKSLRVGQSWELQIQKEIDRCEFMIVLYSPDINRHKNGEEESYMLSEIAYAKYTAHKPIIPIMAQKTEPPISLTMAHYIDFALPNLRFEDLVHAICEEADIRVSSISSLITGHRVQGTATVRDTSLSIMPQPFAWITIPRKFLVRATYNITKYPVTNAQFAEFIEAGGYTNPHWWIDEGWRSKQRGVVYNKENREWVETNETWTEPLYWQDSRWNGEEQPVVGVSWYESLAFCWWLSDITGEKITLPTEDQWQYAAQGDDRRHYPWGNEWDSSRCNNSVFDHSKSTTSVTQYEGKGDSPFGVVDLTGNVWEWCLTPDPKHYNHCIIHGGAWDQDILNYLKVTNGHHFNPSSRSYNLGFRCVRSS